MLSVIYALRLELLCDKAVVGAYVRVVAVAAFCSAYGGGTAANFSYYCGYGLFTLY